MAGGIDWFRWHHGAVTDPKFQLVAKKSGASVAEVIAVWATILEAASQAEERGSFDLDLDAIDCALGMQEGKAQAIIKEMHTRDLVSNGRVKSWDKRQPKREREDNTNADRQAAFRERKRQVTPSNATSHQKTPRVEKSIHIKAAALLVNQEAPVDNSPPAAAAVLSSVENPKTRESEIAVMLIALEADRGKTAKISPFDTKLRSWAISGITDAQIREAYLLALEDRIREKSDYPINCGFLDVFIGRILAPHADKAVVVQRPQSVCECCGITATKQIGTRWFCRDHDQYSGVPGVTSLRKAAA